MEELTHELDGVPVIEPKPQSEWTYEEWIALYPEGIPEDDPNLDEKAAMMRGARAKERGKSVAKLYIIGPDGEVVSKEDFDKMSAGEKRMYTVGRTCSHFEHDVPGMSDFH